MAQPPVRRLEGARRHSKRGEAALQTWQTFPDRKNSLSSFPTRSFTRPGQLKTAGEGKASSKIASEQPLRTEQEQRQVHTEVVLHASTSHHAS